MTSLIDTFWNEYQLALNAEPSLPQYEERKARWQTLARKSFLLSVSVPALDRIAVQTWRAKTGRRALLTTLAVVRYVQKKGVHPPTLDALVAEGYMSELPIDPYSGEAFGYHRTGDGFLLYSWGQNHIDDGGRQGTGQDGKPRKLWTDTAIGSSGR